MPRYFAFLIRHCTLLTSLHVTTLTLWYVAPAFDCKMGILHLFHVFDALDAFDVFDACDGFDVFDVVDVCDAFDAVERRPRQV